MADPPRAHSRFASISSLASVKALTSPRAINNYLVPLLILIAIVLASSFQTELAHYTSTSLGYNQPYFSFFLTHITFTFVFPLHLVALLLFHPRTWRRRATEYFDGLRHIIADQLGDDALSWRQLGPRWAFKVLWLTLLISVPALSWFIAMVFTRAIDVTAIYATSSFHAYFFSMLLLKQPLSRTTLGSIVLAFAGVLVISLAGAVGGEEEGASNRFLGDGVMMFGGLIPRYPTGADHQARSFWVCTRSSTRWCFPKDMAVWNLPSPRSTPPSMPRKLQTGMQRRTVILQLVMMGYTPRGVSQNRSA